MNQKLTDCSGNRLAVDQIIGLKIIGLSLTQALTHRPLHPHEARAKLVFSQLTDATHATIAKVIDVINLTPAIAQGDQQLDGVENILIGQRHWTNDLFAAQAAVKFHAADCRKIVRVFVKKSRSKSI